MRYTVLVNGKQRYARPMSMRKAKLKADYLRSRGYALVEVVTENFADKITPESEGLNKFGAIRTELDGIVFDSKAEAGYYAELMVLKRTGIVREVQLKPKFVLLLPYPHPQTGKIVRGIAYIADFLVTYQDGRQEVVDVKSNATKTSTYKLKKKLFESKYGIPLVEVLR